MPPYPSLIQILVAIVAFVLIWVYLIPLLPHPFDVVAQIVLIVGAIIWLLRWGGLAA